MAMRISGIGTTYIGRTNLRESRRTCEHCGRPAVLSDYQTRLWLTVLIPILPIGRRQILSYCSSCTGHRVMSVAEWERFATTYIREAGEEFAEDPANAALGLALLGALSIVGRDDEAAQIAEQIAQTFADDAETLCRLAEWFRLAGSLDRAEATYVHAASRAPDSRFPAIGLLAVDIAKGRLDRAHERIGTLDNGDEPVDPDLLLSLATAHQQQNQHQAALDVFKTVLAHHPETGHYKDMRRLVRTSEEAIGSAATILPRRRPPLTRIVAAAVIICAIAGAVLFNHYAATHRPLLLVNGLADPVDVTIGEAKPVTVGAYAVREITLAEGEHVAHVTLAGGAVHSQPFTLGGSIDARLVSRPTCVLNLLGAAIVVREQAWFSANPASARGSDPLLMTGADLLVLNDVDYVFTDMPATITSSRTADQSVTRLGIIDLSPAVVMDWAITIDDRTDLDALMTHAESHLAITPDDFWLLLTYYRFAEFAGRLDRCRDVLASRLDDRPMRIDWHRFYQQACEATEQAAIALQRYEALLAAEPTNANALYLTGRLQATCARAMHYTDRAIAADPTHGHAWLAKSYYLELCGRFADAQKAAGEALERADNGPLHLAALTRLEYLALAQGHYDDLGRRARESLAAEPVDLSAQVRLMAAMIGAGDKAGAQAAHATYAAAVAAVMADNVHKVQVRSQLALHYLLGDYAAVEAIAPQLDLPALTQRYLFEAAISAGKIDAAVVAGAASRIDESLTGQLALAVAAHTAGRADIASDARRMAINTLASRGLAEQAAAAMLADPPRAARADAEDLALNDREKALVLVALVQGGADPRLLELAGALNADPSFPHPVIAKAIDRARTQAE